MRTRSLAAVTAAAALALSAALSGCSALGGDDGDAADTVTIATHDSWAMSKEVLADFRKQTGITVKIQPQGDGGELTNKLVLTKDNPIADGVYGIDNTFASRAVDEGVFAGLGSAADKVVDAYAAPGDGADQLLPVDTSDVCVNIDDTWFAARGLTPPATLADLVKPAYKGLFVTPGASSSSPGMAFLLATIGAYGEQWPAYWKKLMANGTKVTADWTGAYEVDFTASGKGDRPIVLSYSSSPPFTVPEGKDRPTTSALLDTCFRQVEYAGVLKGAEHPAAARKFLEFMLSREFQSALPDNMYVYPVLPGASLPPEWAKFAPKAEHPLAVPAGEIAAKRNEWLRQWRDIATG